MTICLKTKTREFFRIYEGESGKVLLFALLGAFLQCGISVGVSAADALFLNHAGADQLPLVYLLSPLVIIAYIASHTLLISRVGIERVLDITLVFLAAVILGIALLLTAPGLEETPQSLYYAIKLTSMVAYVALYTLFWNVTDSYFNILDAKRLFAYLSAGCALGAAAGGALVHALSSVVRVEELLLIWAGITLATLPAAIFVRKKWKKIESESISEDRSVREEVRNLSRTYRRSPFAIAITASLLFTLFVSLLCEYQFYGILAANRNDSELASLLGRLNCAVSIFNLFVNLFIFNRLVERVGVRNVALLQSVAYTAVFCLLVVEHTEFAAVFGFFVYHGLFLSVDGNNFNLLLNALPTRERKQLRTFIEGACEPLAHALVGGGLVFAAAALSPAQISSIGLAAAVVCFFLALVLRASYVQAMVQNLRSCWLDFSRALDSGVLKSAASALTSNDIARLLARAAESTPAERRALEAQISALGTRAVPGCVRALESDALPLPARSLAARVLSKVSFQQLESMANGLVGRTLRAAYDTFLEDREIRSLPLSDEIKSLSVKLSRDRRDSMIEFMLEILTLSGRLASFEPLAASLRSSDFKSRGTAIETVEQACTREVRRLLRPLLDERESEKRLGLAERLNPHGLPPVVSRLTALSEGSNDLEAAYALEVLMRLDPVSAETQARQRLADSPAGISHEVAVDLIAKIQGEAARTIFERAGELLKHRFADGLGVRALVALAEAVRVQSERGAPRRTWTISGVKVDADSLVLRSRRDASVAKSLYQLIRNSADERRAAL